MSWYELSHRDHVAHLRLNRPEALNTLLPEFWTEFPELIAQIDDGRTRALVISSTGRHFTAGLDLSVLTEGGLFGNDPATEAGRQRSQVYQGIRTFQAAFTALERCRLPVIAAIQGGCIGGGLGLVSACDLRYASTDAFFVLQETNLGITPDVGQLQRLPRVLPDAVLRELAYRGHRLDAARAEQVGFVNALFADQEALLAGALAVAEEIATKSPLAIWGAKTAIGYAQDHTVADGLDQIALWQAAMYHRSDSAEALGAKSEDRPAHFEDLPPA